MIGSLDITVDATVRIGFVGAYRPWNSPYREEKKQRYPDSAMVERCMTCPLSAECCDHCDGTGKIKRRGRPRKNQT